MNQIELQNNIIKTIYDLLAANFYYCDRLCKNNRLCKNCKLNVMNEDLKNFIKKY